ncbi:glycoside hydrolase family 20 protein [Dothidotthia symphoricarpi CBS 119687]|uniref:Beta-hexosaminidase n=1 Tax=Dothidotthia symphoricarpi CBS 119687 TaxID=1392245 RepID=A0A6A6AV49_9PLEO|nr:glycoside hydrolase family 20 protein [Dothidotthia symphoricarpi CBS 119687]KAF2134835.1 glycoside hydrolase family 20 protein [Dothidotthia symphoricarpi CBS 119687]
MKALVTLPFFVCLAAAIWPLPVNYEHGDTVLWITDDIRWDLYEADTSDVGSIVDERLNQNAFVLASNSNRGPEPQEFDSKLKFQKRYIVPSLDDQADYETEEEVSGKEIIDYAIRSTWTKLFKKNFYPWKFHPRDWSEPSLCEDSTKISVVNIHLLSADPSTVGKPLAGAVDESYTLTLSKEGKATIAANSSIGIARGLTTFTQLFYAHSNAEDVYTPLAPITIYDVPAFQHRGINLDVSRAYFPLADIKRQIDACAYNKMNRFHLHVTDSQAWPLEIPSMPELSAKGAYHPSLVYTAQDFADMQRHAAIQGVELITEIDMPGHTSSIWFSRPELIVAFNEQPDWGTYAKEPPSGTLKLNSTAVFKFLENLFDDLLPRVHPYSSYFHTGGDEVNMHAYAFDETVRSDNFTILQPLMQKFIDRNHGQIRAKGLTPMVWEEMLLVWSLTLGDDVIVQSWRSDKAVAQIVEKGHKVLVGNYNYWYLDCGKGQWVDFSSSNAAIYWPYNDYCAPFHNWRLIYSYDPLSGIPPEHHHLVIGGEAHLWAEQTDPVNIDRMIWPRGSAAAEILWSGAKDAQGQNRSQIEASPRLSEMRERLVAMGVGAEPIQMPYCTMNGTQCQM